MAAAGGHNEDLLLFQSPNKLREVLCPFRGAFGFFAQRLNLCRSLARWKGVSCRCGRVEFRKLFQGDQYAVDVIGIGFGDVAGGGILFTLRGRHGARDPTGLLHRCLQGHGGLLQGR